MVFFSKINYFSNVFKSNPYGDKPQSTNYESPLKTVLK